MVAQFITPTSGVKNWGTFVIAALRRQEDCFKFKASLGYRARHYLKHRTTMIIIIMTRAIF